MATGNGEGTKKSEAMYRAKQRSNKDAYPDKGTSRYNQNEKIINQNSVLKKARDISQGFTHTSTITTAGDTSQQYKDNYDKIDFSKREKTEKPKFKVRVNGVLQYPEDDND